MTRFVQIIDYTSSKADELSALNEEWRAGRGNESGGPDRVTVVADRDRPGHFMTIVEFDSYERAMENSGRADTSEFAGKMAALCDGPPTFHNLDVTEVWEPVTH